MYKYTPSQHFGPHYDDSVKDAATGAKSEWTLLIYLTGIEDGVKGGEVRVCGCICWAIPLKCPKTVFYKDQKGIPSEAIVAPLTRGTALLHRCVPMITLLHSANITRRHGYECLLHEGSPVQKGTKYVLRSDLMFLE